MLGQVSQPYTTKFCSVGGFKARPFSTEPELNSVEFTKWDKDCRAVILKRCAARAG
jgi:hypothetical protein